MSIHDIFSKSAKAVTQWSGSIYATAIAILTVLIWILGGFVWWGFGLYSQSAINSIATLETFLIVFLIQHSANLSDKIINLKLDEIIRAIKRADNQMICLDNLTPEQLQELQQKYKEIAQVSQGKSSESGY